MLWVTAEAIRADAVVGEPSQPGCRQRGSGLGEAAGELDSPGLCAGGGCSSVSAAVLRTEETQRGGSRLCLCAKSRPLGC